MDLKIKAIILNTTMQTYVRTYIYYTIAYFAIILKMVTITSTSVGNNTTLEWLLSLFMNRESSLTAATTSFTTVNGDLLPGNEALDN